MCPLPRRESKANRGDPLQLSYGRIDTHDRTLRQAVQDEAAARKLVGQHLRRRATAPGRIGVGYRLILLCQIVPVLSDMACLGVETPRFRPRLFPIKLETR